MWKSVLLIVVAFPLAVIAFIGFWVATDFKGGLIAACITLATCLIAATLMVFSIKKFSLADVFLPLGFSVVWSIMLIPFSFSAEVFSAPAAIGSGLILTICLWRVYHRGGQGRGWLIIPVVSFLYEMMPINLPGQFDDLFAFGGAVGTTILFYGVDAYRNQLSAGESRRDEL